MTKKNDIIYRTVVENLTAAVFKTDLAGRWMLLNPAWTEITGFSLEESLGVPFTDFVHPDERQANLDLFVPLMEQETAFCRHETRYLTKSGGYRWIEVHARLVFNEMGEPEGATGTLTDITERKQMEDQNRALVLALEAAMDGIALVNDKGEYTHLNKSHVEMFGYSSAAELVGRTWRDIYDADEITRIENEVFPVLMASGSWTGSATAKRKDGSKFPEELSLTALPNGGLVCICRDVTEKTRSASALRESETRWQLVVQSMRDGVWDADLTTGVVHLSEGWKALLGLADDELVTTQAKLRERLHPDDLKAIVEPNDPRGRLGTWSYDAELRMRDNDGKYRWLQVRGRGLSDGNGKTVRMIGIATDIAARKKVYEQLLANLAREKELSEMKTHFVSMASHELRTPMATLSLALEFLTAYRTELSQQKIERSLANANEAARQLSSIIDDLLLLGRADEGRLKCEPQSLNLRDLLVSIATESRLPGEHRRRIKTICDPPILQVDIDPQLLRHILLNLLSNACKYSDDATPVFLRVNRTEGGIEFQVLDSGIGICEEDQSRIFSLFFRGQNVGAIPGTGLGLMVVKHCVAAHGGTINFESQQGQGSCFTIYLPC